MVTQLTDLGVVRALLLADRLWAIYALGDLTPGLVEHCEWFAGEEGALAMVYRAFELPVLFTLGGPAAVQEIVNHLDLPTMFLLVRPDILPILEPRYTLRHLTAMWRMILKPHTGLLDTDGRAAPLDFRDLEALQRLYATDTREDDQRFFTASMLENGVYYGVWENADLVSAAGTHLVAPAEGVAAIGNVYTRPDRRGQGLARRVVSAVVGELQRRSLPTIGLNVARNNPAAIRVYERLGFEILCPFYEAEASMKPRQEKMIDEG